MTDKLRLKLREAIEDIEQHTDGWPWYWFSCGEKCYVFVVASMANYDPSFDRPF